MKARRFLRTGLARCRSTPKVVQDTALSRVAEPDTRPNTWPDPIEAGDPGQVTTATPAGLDFRATGVADEGCADTMSAESNCSIAPDLPDVQDGNPGYHRQAPGKLRA